MFQFIKDTRAEMANVTWPSRKKTITYTFAVIVISAVVAYYLGFLDMLFSKAIGYIILK
jgi:preprotein translocase SecE subunit